MLEQVPEPGVFIDRRVFRPLRRRRRSQGCARKALDSNARASRGANIHAEQHHRLDSFGPGENARPRHRDDAQCGGEDFWDDPNYDPVPPTRLDPRCDPRHDPSCNLRRGQPLQEANYYTGAYDDPRGGQPLQDANYYAGGYDEYCPYERQDSAWLEDAVPRTPDRRRQRPSSAPIMACRVRSSAVPWSPPKHHCHDVSTFSNMGERPAKSDRVARGAQMRSAWMHDRFLQNSRGRKFDLRGCGSPLQGLSSTSGYSPQAWR